MNLKSDELLSNFAFDVNMRRYSAESEVVNGRAAMVGIASLIVVEAVKGSALL